MVAVAAVAVVAVIEGLSIRLDCCEDMGNKAGGGGGGGGRLGNDDIADRLGIFSR